MVVMGEYRLLLFDGLKVLLTQDHMGPEIQKRYSSYSFYPMSANSMRTLATMEEYRLLRLVAIDRVLKTLWYFEIFTWESMGK